MIVLAIAAIVIGIALICCAVCRGGSSDYANCWRCDRPTSSPGELCDTCRAQCDRERTERTERRGTYVVRTRWTHERNRL